MKIGKLGISFNYHGEELCWLWWWNRQGYKYYISKDGFTVGHPFKTLRDYWVYKGVLQEACRKGKVRGFKESDLFLDWVDFRLKGQVAVVLCNMDASRKPTAFWSTIPKTERKELLKDIVVLYFNDYDKAWEVFQSIRPDFADAFLVNDGRILTNNLNETVALSE